MSNENWEEINEFDFEEFDLAQTITVHSVVHHLNVSNDVNCNEVEELEYQLVQAFKQPTYAAAAKWGNRKNKKSIDINAAAEDINHARDIVNIEEKKQERKLPNILSGDHEVDYDECNLANSSSKQSSLNINQSTTTPPPESAASPSVTPVKSVTPATPASNFTDSEPSDYCKSSSRRHNNHVHKVSTQRLLEQLSSPVTLEVHADAVKGDTNRNPEYKKYKILKKSMRYKNSGSKSKDRKGNVDKRVEVW